MKNKFDLSSFVYRVMFLVFWGLLILGQFQRVGLRNGIAFSLHEIVLAVGVFWLWGAHGRWAWNTMWSKSWSKVLVLFFSWLIIGLILAFLRQNQFWSIGVLYAVRFLLYVSVYPIFVLGIKRQYITKRDILWRVLGLGLGIAGIGLVQYAIFPDMRFLQHLGWDDHYFRLISTLFDPAFSAAVIFSALFMVPIFTVSPVWKKYAMYLLLFLALLLTYSRAGYVSVVAGMVTTSVLLKKKNILLGIITLTIGIIFLPRLASEGTRLERTASITARITSFRSTVQSFSLQTFVIGDGWYLKQAGRVPQVSWLASHSSAPDNSYLHVLQSTGIPGFALYIAFLILLFKKVRVSPYLAGLYVAIVVGSFWNNLLFYPWIMVILWSMATVSRRM